MNRFATIGLIIFICLAPLTLGAAQFDGSVPLLCAVVQVMECGTDGECHSVAAEDANIPRFLKIDFAMKTISATEDSGREEVSAIKNFERDNGKMILQGAEGGRGWTIVISEQTGKMTATVSDDQAGFVIFGASTQR